MQYKCNATRCVSIAFVWQKAPPVGLECILRVLILRGNCRVDTWENATAKRITIFAHPIRVATAWQRKGLCVAHAVSDLCRISLRCADGHVDARRSYSANEFWTI